jgi:hypothetical protein
MINRMKRLPRHLFTIIRRDIIQSELARGGSQVGVHQLVLSRWVHYPVNIPEPSWDATFNDKNNNRVTLSE